MILQDFDQFGGAHSEFGALRNALAYQGVVNPNTGQPLSEAVLFGIGAGVGASYFSFAYEGHDPTLSISMAGRYKAKYGEMLQRSCQRLGLQTTFKTTKSDAVAMNNVKKGLALTQPVLVQTIGTPFYALQGYERFGEEVLLVYGLDEAAGLAYIASRSASPLTLMIDQLTAVRSTYTPLKNLSLAVTPGMINLEQAIKVGLQETVTLMLNPPKPQSNFGLNALQKWAQLVADGKGKKGWLKLFTPGNLLYQALAGVFAQIELVTVDGGGLRGLYAMFLNEAATILGQPALQDVATAYQQVAQLWTAVAEAALPDEVPGFAETKEWMRQKRDLFSESGTAVVEQLTTINQQQTAVATQMSDDFPLDEDASRALLANLSQQILHLYAAEAQAIKALEQTISGKM